MLKTKSGFTIVELLIVIVVIAILAAISIVAYSGIQSRAKASAVSNALTQAKKKIALWQIDNPNLAPDCDTFKELTNSTGASCTGAGVTINNITYQYSPNNPTAGLYCITATLDSVSYTITGISPPSSGGCNGHGQGGALAITNLALNPSSETNITGWSTQNNNGSASTVIRDSTQAHSGNASGKYTVTSLSTNNSYPRLIAGGVITNAPAGTYTGSIWAKGPSGSHLRLAIISGASTLANSSIVALSPSSWTRVSLTATTTSDAQLYLYAIPVNSSGQATSALLGDYYIDSVMITEGETLYSYADGSSINWIWNDTVNNSTSTGPVLQ
jgi:prepilin-type N-terminal cleavage/methylation domain-containing protein